MSLIPRITDTTAEQDLSSPEMRRYARHLIMPEVTVEGQRKLKASRVLAIGTGGLGSPLLAYLAAAGVGRLGIVDFDRVDESNLQRQIIHRQTSIGQAKVESARRTIAELNPHVDVVTHEIALRSDNALDLFRDYDVVVDGTDNFPTRYRQRRVRPSGETECLRIHLSLRRTMHRLLGRKRALLPLPLPRTSSSRQRPQLRRRWRSWNPPRRNRRATGD